MSKEKWKAWFITTLVLFTLVRIFESFKGREVEPVNDKKVESQNLPTDENNSLKDTNVQEINLKQGKISTKKRALSISKSNLKQLPQESTLIKDKAQLFSNQSLKVYFKVENGLALVASDMLIGQIKEEPGSKDFKHRVFEKELEKTMLWPSATIPYGFTENISSSLKKEIETAVKYLNDKTSLNLVPIEPALDEDAIVFDKKDGAPCSSYVGRIGGLQPIFVNEAKCKQQEILHEILHAIGFVHEQQRASRNQKLEILWENIKEEMEHNFAILPDSLIHPYSGSVFEIDFESVMMYPDDAFTKSSGLKSMKSLNNDEKINPSKDGLSKRDIERINYLYGS